MQVVPAEAFRNNVRPGHQALSLDLNAGQGLFRVEDAVLPLGLELVQVGGNHTLRDYRPVDGVLVPHRIEISRKGGWAAYEFHAVIHEGALTRARFVKP